MIFKKRKSLKDQLIESELKDLINEVNELKQQLKGYHMIVAAIAIRRGGRISMARDELARVKPWSQLVQSEEKGKLVIRINEDRGVLSK